MDLVEAGPKVQTRKLTRLRASSSNSALTNLVIGKATEIEEALHGETEQSTFSNRNRAVRTKTSRAVLFRNDRVEQERKGVDLILGWMSTALLFFFFLFGLVLQGRIMIDSGWAGTLSVDKRGHCDDKICLEATEKALQE